MSEMIKIYTTKNYRLGAGRVEWTDGVFTFIGTQDQARDYYRGKYPARVMTFYKHTKKRKAK